MKRLLFFLVSVLVCLSAFAQSPIQAFKYRVDTSITLKTGPRSITPTAVGERIKEGVDLIPRELKNQGDSAIILVGADTIIFNPKHVDSIYITGTTLYYKKGKNTFNIPLPGLIPQVDTIYSAFTNGHLINYRKNGNLFSFYIPKDSIHVVKSSTGDSVILINSNGIKLSSHVDSVYVNNDGRLAYKKNNLEYVLPPTQDLQSTTDLGNSTTLPIIIGGLTIKNIQTLLTPGDTVLTTDPTGLVKKTKINLADSKVNSISALRTITGIANNQLIDVLGYYIANDFGGGKFYWDDTATVADNGGTVIKPTVISTPGRWKRIYNKDINFKWFGAKGDGISDDTDPCQRAIDAFQGTGYNNKGYSFYFTKGTYLVANLRVKTGTVIKADQKAKDHYISDVPVVIKAYGNPTYIIEVDTLSTNWGIHNLYIEGDYVNQPQLVAGVRLRGQKCDFIGNNVHACAQYGVLSDAGLIHMFDNSIFGWYGSAPTFTGINDFRGALHMPALGDSWVRDNEVGAGLSYFTSTVTPRDPVNGRICAMYLGSIFGGTSVFEGNLFENGDRCVVIGNSLYATFTNNRYELSAMGGLYLVGPTTQFLSFTNERFSDNSLTASGVYNDIDVAVGAAGHVSFVSPIFERLYNVAIPNSTNKVKWLISNYGSTEIDLVTPNVDTSYYLKGWVNNEDVQALPIRIVEGQYDPKNPKYASVSTEKLPADLPTTGYVKLTRGTDASNLSLTGGVQFYAPGNIATSLIGFNASPDLWFTLNQANGSYNFLNGGINSYRNDGSYLSLNSLNGLGTNSLAWKSDLIPTHNSQITMDNTTGVMRWVSDTSIIIGATGNGNIRFNLNGATSLPFKPLVGTTANSILTRDTITGDIKYLNTSDLVAASNPVVNILLPDDVYAVEGVEFNLYRKEIILADFGYNDLYVDYDCAKGRQYDSRFTFTPVAADSGTYSLTMNVYYKQVIVASKVTNLHVTKRSAGSGTRRIIMLGDSQIQSGAVIDTIKADYVDAMVLSFTGTQATLGGNYMEGRRGWTWDDYTTAGRTFYKFATTGVTVPPVLNSVYTHNGSTYTIQEVNFTNGQSFVSAVKTAGVNDPTASGVLTKTSGNGDATISFTSYVLGPGSPIWNGRVDIASYLTTNGITMNADDWWVVELGTNDMNNLVDASSITNAINNALIKADTLINAIRAVSTSTRILFVLNTLEGSQDGAGNLNATGMTAWKHGDNIRRYTLAVLNKYNNATYRSNNIFLLSAAGALDTRNNMTTTVRKINARTPETEIVQTDYLHPNSFGYAQVADAYYSIFKWFK